MRGSGQAGKRCIGGRRRTSRLDGAVQLPRGLPLAQLAVAGAVAEVAAAGAHPVCGRGGEQGWGLTGFSGALVDGGGSVQETFAWASPQQAGSSWGRRRAPRPPNPFSLQPLHGGCVEAAAGQSRDDQGTAPSRPTVSSVHFLHILTVPRKQAVAAQRALRSREETRRRCLCERGGGGEKGQGVPELPCQPLHATAQEQQ
jgi:hypothetical protein